MRRQVYTDTSTVSICGTFTCRLLKPNAQSDRTVVHLKSRQTTTPYRSKLGYSECRYRSEAL